MRAYSIAKLLVVAIYPLVLLTAFATTASQAQACRANCELPIELPSDQSQRPAAPAETRIVGGEVLDFVLSTQAQANGRTVLAFEEAAFMDRQGNPIYVLELRAGSNRFESRPHDHGVCHAPRGCRYVVINVGTPTRPAVINSPIIIIEPN